MSILDLLKLDLLILTSFNPIVYNMKRTICDLVRNRRCQDSEIFGKALRAYVSNPKKDIHRLREYAKQFGILRQVDDILEILDE